MRIQTTEPHVRFWKHVEISNDCWEWKASIHPNGYGRFNLNGKIVKAHRMAFFFAFGYWPKVCMHTCDNPKCVRPFHLKNATQLENLRDMSAKGRSYYQSKTCCAQGHPWDFDNTYINKRGHRKCRTCARFRKQKERMRAHV